MSLTSRILLAVAIGCSIHLIAAQAPADAPKAPHHEPHPAVQDPSRFFTTRRTKLDLPLPGEEGAFAFAVFGDRTGGVPEGVRVLEQAVSDVNLIEPDLVMTVGDLIQGYNQTPEWLEQMREYKGVMNRLKMPWFPVAGNHDVYWRGEGQRPDGEHEGNYEAHFGPLWYAFRHKTAWFIALYSDEGDAQGNKALNRPEAQTMSPAQFAFLDETLKRAKGAEHVFLFLHHPRWLGGGYGDDWQRVHRRLAEAGNVSAVFAGHIHRMRYDGARDGIEYFTLATTGGNNSMISAEAGYLHHYHLVTVRKGRLAVTAVPVGDVMDVRAITGEISDAARTLNDQLRLSFEPRRIEVSADQPLDAKLTLSTKNPLQRPIELTIVPNCRDGRFRFVPDHLHAVIPAGETLRLDLRILRDAGPLDAAFDIPRLDVQADYLAPGARFKLMEERFDLPVLPGRFADLAASAENGTLKIAKAEDAVMLDPKAADFEAEHFTLEGWIKADRFVQRQGFINKTEQSEYGFFVNRGRPQFSIHVGGAYAVAEAREGFTLETGRWHHLAAAYDGSSVLLWVDGKLVAEAKGTGQRKRNALPLVVGADVDRNGRATSPFLGEIDEIRISKGLRYPKEGFTPERRLAREEATLLLLSLDRAIGPYYPDASGAERHARRAVSR